MLTYVFLACFYNKKVILNSVRNFSHIYKDEAIEQLLFQLENSASVQLQNTVLTNFLLLAHHILFLRRNDLGPKS